MLTLMMIGLGACGGGAATGATAVVDLTGVSMGEPAVVPEAATGVDMPWIAASGPESVVAVYETGTCGGERDAPSLPRSAVAVYGPDEVVLTLDITLDCVPQQDVAFARAVDLVLTEEIGDRQVSIRTVG